jgi:broad specificity phosphatase PhoE
MTRIILVRHGRTPWNKNKIFRGSRDIPLDEVGREEASLLAEWLKGETIHAAYTSPLSRSSDTAEAVARHRASVNRFNRIEDTWHIMALNDAYHLRGMQRGEYIDF